MSICAGFLNTSFVPKPHLTPSLKSRRQWLQLAHLMFETRVPPNNQRNTTYAPTAASANNTSLATAGDCSRPAAIG